MTDSSSRSRLANELGRKGFHLALLLLIPAGRMAGERAGLLAIGALVGSLAIEAARGTFAATWFERWLGPLLRPRERSGPLGCTSFLTVVAIAAQVAPWANVELMIWVFLWADAAAAIGGRLLDGAEGRTRSGSACHVLVGTLAGLVWGIGWPAALLAVASAAAERVAGRLHVDDNWIAPPVVLCISIVGGWPT